MGRFVRARAALYALLVAVCQFGLSVSASAVMLTAAHGSITAVAEADCSCEHSAAVMCPMHRRNAPRPVPAAASPRAQMV